MKRHLAAIRAFFVAVTIAIAATAFAPRAYATITMPATPNEANLVLVVRFSDETSRNTYNTTKIGTTTAWQYAMTDFKGDFRNYVAAVSRGKLNVQSLFPQDNNGTLEYLDLSISSTDIASKSSNLYDVDSAIVSATSEAFNKKYPNWDASQANLDDKPAHIDNIMILVDTALDSTTGLRSNMNRINETYNFGNLPMQDVEVIHATRAGSNLAGAIDAVPAHEYLHRLGAKDLYRNGGSEELCDGWDMMATARPSLLPLAQTASDMGFLDIQTVASQTGTYEFELGDYLSDDSSKPHAVAIKSPLNGSEYFVLEYRQGDLTALNGYTADRYLGGKVSTDHSGTYDGVLISRVNTSADGKTNGKDDYLYVYRPGDTATKSPGGDGKTNTIKNAAIKAGNSFGSSAISDGIEQNALCYTDGTNSRIVVTVESAENGSAKVKVEIPDYSDQSPWEVVKGSDGSSSISFSNTVCSPSLAAIGDTLWGVTSEYWTGAVKLITSKGDGWTLRQDALGTMFGATITEHKGYPVVSGIATDYRSAIVKTYNGSTWTEKKLKFDNNINSAKAFSCDGSLYLAAITIDSNSKYQAFMYNIDNNPTQVGQALSPTDTFGASITDVCMLDSTHIAVSGDLSLGTTSFSILELKNGNWTLSQAVDFPARYLSVAKVGNKQLLFSDTGTSGSTGQLFELSNNNLNPVSSNLNTGVAKAALSSDGTCFYLNAVTGTNLDVYSSSDGTKWVQLGDTVKSVSEASNATFLAGKAYILASVSNNNNYNISLRSHTPAAAAGFYDVSDYKHGSDDTSAWTAPSRYGYAFAGWYADEACTQAYTATSGSAYARFVPVSELVRGQGPSLRSDAYAEHGYDMTTIRYCYGFDVPGGCTRTSAGWDWTASWSGRSGTARASSYWLSSGGGILANAVFGGVARADYASACTVRGFVEYTTADGTAVTAREATAREGSAESAARAILAGGAGNEADRTYARGILG